MTERWEGRQARREQTAGEKDGQMIVMPIILKGKHHGATSYTHTHLLLYICHAVHPTPGHIRKATISPGPYRGKRPINDSGEREKGEEGEGKRETKTL